MAGELGLRVNEILVFAWLIPLVVCFLIWPVLRRRRGAMVAAAVLCLTPIWVAYISIDMPIAIGPLALSLPANYTLLFEGLEGFFRMILPFGIVVGFSIWLVWARVWRRRNQDAEAD